MEDVTKFYTVVCFGSPTRGKGQRVTSEENARAQANAAKGSGSCTSALVYECDTRKLAMTADISERRDGERVVYSA